MKNVHGSQDTIDWYNKNAKLYSDSTFKNDQNSQLFTSLLPGKKILDAGCGPGHDTNMFFQMEYDAVGVDISEGLIAEAKHKYPNCIFVEGNLLTLPFKKNTFDGVWSQASLLHLETEMEVKRALKEFYRVLKSDGILYVYVKKQEGKEKTAVVSDSVSHHDRFFQYFSVIEIKDLFKTSGFSVLKTEVQEDRHGRNDVHWIMVIGRKL